MDQKTLYENAFKLISANLKLNEFAGNVDSTIELDSIRLNQHLKDVSSAIIHLTDLLRFYRGNQSEINTHIKTLRKNAFNLEVEYPPELHDSDINMEEINGKLCLIYQSKLNEK
jgi:hypothetical protein